jgi:hypothetical protein
LKSEYDMPPFQNKYLRRTRTGGYGNLLVPVEDKPDKTL